MSPKTLLARDNCLPLQVTIVTEKISLPSPPAVLLPHLKKHADPVILESSARHDDFGRYSIITCNPLEIITLSDGKLADSEGNYLARGDNNEIWNAISQALSCVNAEDRGETCPYVPGWIGYLGYELASMIETLPSTADCDNDLPDLRLAFYDAIAIYDAISDQWSLIYLEFDREIKGSGRAARALRSLSLSLPRLSLLADASLPSLPMPIELSTGQTQEALPKFKSNFTRENYLRAVEKCLSYIAAGDIFQVNLSQRLMIDQILDPIDIYLAMISRNPAWYAAFLSFTTNAGLCSVISASPEMFLSVRGSDVITRPIKGTMPRKGDAKQDSASVAKLLASEKDHAELTMIVDLLRNDLGKICKFDSVKVVESRRLETHPTVFHLVSTITGQLVDDANIADLLRATFPGGSITGAPKIRAMEIIDEIEPTERGIYTGAIGIVCVNGVAQFNIAIRTAVCTEDKTFIQVGGGIVADSTPQDEYEETLHKARGMLEAISIAKRYTTE